MTNLKRTKKLRLAIFSTLIMCLTLVFGVFITSTPVYAISAPVSSSASKNLNFAYDNNSTIYTNPTGWTKGLQTNTTSGSIKLTATNYDSYKLTADQIPNKIENSDDYALMLNPKTTTTAKLEINRQYYETSNSFSLNPYSYYEIKVYSKVLSGGIASIKVTGLKDDLSFTGINYDTAREWTDFTFYISTGIDSQSINLQLWLGTPDGGMSPSAVFFDNVEINQISQNEIKTDSESRRIKSVNLNNSMLVDDYLNLDKDETNPSRDFNADFEANTLAHWSQIGQMQTNTYGEVINLSNNNQSTAKEITYVGTDLSNGNNNALVLYTKDDTKSYFGYKSENIELKANDIVKISVNAKVADLDGSAFVKLIENDVLDFKGEIIDTITPASNSITISSNTTNQFTNNYNTYTFLVRGRNLYNTSLKLELWLGSSENLTSGLVAFDNIKIEPISYEQYTKQSTSSSTVKMELSTNKDSFTIKNASFNDAQKKESNLTYPLVPANWTHTAKEDTDVFFGVINTNDSIYNATNSQFGGFENPGNPAGFTSTKNDTNNILLMQNINKTYQQVKSSAFEVSANSYYKLTFAYKLLQTSSTTEIFNVFVQDDNANVLYADQNIASNNAWETYTIYINTKSYTNELDIIFSLGSKDNEVQGIAYIDNVILSKLDITADEYSNLAKENNVLDFQEGNFNLVEEGRNGVYTPFRYTGKLEKGENPSNGDPVAFGGIIDVTNENDAYPDMEKSPNSTSSLNYIMMLETTDLATYTLTAKDKLSLVGDSYYKFSVDILTSGIGEPESNDSNEKYGATFALSGIEEKIEGVVANSWTTYTLYVASTDAIDVSLIFGLASLDVNSSGNAFFDNYTFETIDKDTYNLAKLNNENDDTFLFVGDTDADTEDEDGGSSVDLDYIWYVIPTALLVIALVLAMVTSLMKKFRIKKWEKRKINEYDRDKTVHRDVIRKQAEEKRDAEIKEIKARIAEMEKEKERIEAIHQEQLKNSRLQRSKGVSKATEREFKQYAKLSTAIENRIASANKQIENMNSAEYLLSVQHKLMIEKAKEARIAKENAFGKNKKRK